MFAALTPKNCEMTANLEQNRFVVDPKIEYMYPTPEQKDLTI